MKHQSKNHKIFSLSIRLFTLLITTSVIGSNSISSLAIKNLKCEYKTNPLGIDNPSPRFSWKMVDNNHTRGQKQTAYQLLVSSSLEFLDKNKGDVWDSGKVISDKSVNNTFIGIALKSSTKYYWKVRIWDVLGNQTNWSEPAKFSMGLFNDSDWKGDWIHKLDQKKTDHNWYRKTFKLKAKASSAFIYVSSFGYHELYVNGKKVTDNVMNPVSSYMKKRIPYLTYDIADFLNKGNNVIAIWHAAGWARWDRITEYRNPPFVFKAQANISTKKEQFILGTDNTWKCKNSHSSYYGDWDILDFGGETIDDRLKEDDWNTVPYNDSNWVNATIYDAKKLNASLEVINDSVEVKEDKLIGKDKFKNRKFTTITAQLSAQMVEPQVKFREIKPLAISKNEDGTYRVDMGENYTGFF